MIARIFLYTAFMFLSGYSATAQSAGTHSQTQQSASGTLKLYPTTAKTYINVYVDWKTARSFSVAIYDSTNALVKEWNESARASYQKSVDISALPTGNYSVAVRSKQEELSGTFIISR